LLQACVCLGVQETKQELGNFLCAGNKRGVGKCFFVVSGFGASRVCWCVCVCVCVCFVFVSEKCDSSSYSNR
jgi:hypothetical protein